MILQLQAIFDFKVDLTREEPALESKSESAKEESSGAKEDITDVMKTRIDTLNLSTRTLNALNAANIRTLGGIARKKEEDLLEIDGLGGKGIEEIKRTLEQYGLSLK
jgi:DNA-directed RNA polymerase subunit alpha